MVIWWPNRAWRTHIQGHPLMWLMVVAAVSSPREYLSGRRWLPSWHGSWLPLEHAIQETMKEAENASMIKSIYSRALRVPRHTATLCWSHSPVSIHSGGNHMKVWIPWRKGHWSHLEAGYHRDSLSMWHPCLDTWSAFKKHELNLKGHVCCSAKHHKELRFCLQGAGLLVEEMRCIKRPVWLCVPQWETV